MLLVASCAPYCCLLSQGQQWPGTPFLIWFQVRAEACFQHLSLSPCNLWWVIAWLLHTRGPRLLTAHHPPHKPVESSKHHFSIQDFPALPRSHFPSRWVQLKPPHHWEEPTNTSIPSSSLSPLTGECHCCFFIISAVKGWFLTKMCT